MEYLYKYKPWNDYTKMILTDQAIYCARPDELNDPFDCKAELFSSNFDMSIDEEMMHHHLSSFILSFLSDSSSRLSQVKKKRVKADLARYTNIEGAMLYIEKFLSKELKSPFPPLTRAKDIIRSFMQQSSNFGVFSLTEDPRNMLMWSHYGDQHKGIAIGFKFDNDLVNQSSCRKVDYNDLFPKIDLSKTNTSLKFSVGGTMQKEVELKLDDPLASAVFFQKAECWSYEKEWRLLETKSGVRILPSPIGEIIFGCRCPEPIISEVKSLVSSCSHERVIFKQIRTAENSFKLLES